MSTKNINPSTAVAAAEAAVTQARAAADAAKARHVEIYAELETARAELQRIDDALLSGDSSLDPEAMVTARHAVDTKRALNTAAGRAQEIAKSRLGEAEAALIAERIKVETDGYRAPEAIRAEVEQLTESFVLELDKVAASLDDRNAFLSNATSTLRKYDGGRSLYEFTPGAIAGVRRVRRGMGDGIEVDGRFHSDSLPELAVYEHASHLIERAGIAEVRARRRDS